MRTKKNRIIGLLLAALTLLPFSSEAWGYYGMLRRGFHIGIAGSANSTWIFNQNNYNTLNLFHIPIVRQSEMDYAFTWGGMVGVNVGYNFHPNLGIQFEPSYSWAGQKYDDNFVGGVDFTNPGSPYYAKDGEYVNVKRIVKMQYFQMPLHFKYQTQIGDEANLYVLLGPQVNVRTIASEVVKIKDVEYIDPKNFTPDQKFKKLDAGISIGAGVDIFAKDWMYFNVGLISYIGITDLNGKEIKGIDWYSKNDVKYQSSHNFYVGLHVGAHFYLGEDWYR
ncbi:MAG: porin family protein [Chitinophagales bacterium]